MNASFQLTPQAADDMEEIWCYIAEEPGCGRQGGNRDRGHLPAVGEVSVDGECAPRDHSSAGEVLDFAKIFELCCCLSTGDGSFAGDCDFAWKARSKDGLGGTVMRTPFFLACLSRKRRKR